MSELVRHAQRDRWVTAILGMVAGAGLAVAVLSVILGQVHASDQAKFAQCVSDWAQKTAARTAYLAPLSSQRNELGTKRDNASSALIEAAINQAPRAKLIRLSQAFEKANDAYQPVDRAYQKAVHDHPVPKTPQYACGGKRAPTPSASRAGSHGALGPPRVTPAPGVPGQPSSAPARFTPGSVRATRTVTVQPPAPTPSGGTVTAFPSPSGTPTRPGGILTPICSLAPLTVAVCLTLGIQ